METSKPNKDKKLLVVEEEDLVDRDKDVFDPILSFDSFEIHRLEIQNFRDLVVITTLGNLIWQNF
jgi:hypothetical protein